MNPEAILGLIASLYTQIVTLQLEVQRLRNEAATRAQDVEEATDANV